MSALRYLLDTNIVSHLVREPTGVVYRHIKTVDSGTICTSVIVECELRYGAVSKGSDRLLEQLRRILGSLPVLALDVDVPVHYARIRTDLQRAGRPIGPNDLLIAAHALSLGLILVTHNTRDFDRVQGLAVEDWLA